MGSEVEALKVTFSTNSNWAEWATLAVFVGLLGDIVVIFIFDLFDKNKSWWEIILAGAATTIIAGGVWGELHFGHRATDTSSQIQALLERQTADANERAVKAELDAAKANARVKEAEARAAEARASAAKAELASLQLQEKFAPRYLTASQVKELRIKLFALKPLFKGRAVKIFAQAADPEAAAFAQQLKGAFDSAGLATELGLGTQFQIVYTGVLVEYTQQPQNILLAAGIFEALSSVGIVAALAVLPPEQPPLIRIAIGGKPEGGKVVVMKATP